MHRSRCAGTSCDGGPLLRASSKEPLRSTVERPYGKLRAAALARGGPAATPRTRRVASIAAWRDWKERQTAAATGLRTVRSTWLGVGVRVRFAA